MNDNDDIPNAALRAHVMDHSFVLALRKTHINMLVQVAHDDRHLGGQQRYSVPAADGLRNRGLLLHCTDVFGRSKRGETQKCFPKPKGEPGDTWSEFYRLTRAGWAVFDLLVEAGLAPALEIPRKRRLVA